MLRTTSVGAAVSECNDSNWVRAHEALSRLARERAALDAEEGRWLLAALRAAAHVHLGFGSFIQYVERLFGYKPRTIQEKLRVAVALEELPATAAALESGALGWSAVRELTRVAVAETEHSWLQLAEDKTVHQLEALVAGKERGATPSASPSSEARRHVLRFEVAAETLCLFREAIDKLRRDSGATLDDDSALMLMARNVLGGPGDEGRASYQIALSVCPACGQGHQQSCGELVPVGADVVAMGTCDGQHLGALPEPVHRALRSLDTAADAHMGAHAEAKAGVHSDDAHAGAHTEDDAHCRRVARSGTRAKQAIPPATRRAVLRRDHHRCSVPGCRNSRFVDLHHLQLRSEGGSNQASNLVTLCSVHHRAAHRGELVVSGSSPEDMTFRHADGSAHGKVTDPRAVEVSAKAFSALRNLGFREGETRRVLSGICDNAGQVQSLQLILLEAVARLTSPNTVLTKPTT